LPAALDAIRRSDRAVVVEGYFDVTALHRAGIHAAVASCGTALTPEHARRLRRYAREVVLLFDGDAAGQRAAERALPLLLAEGLVVLGAFLPPGEDPDTLLAKAGAAALVDVVSSARPLLDRMIAERAGYAKAGARQAADIVRELAPWIDAVPDSVERAGYVRDLAARLEHAPETVDAAIVAARERTPARDRAAEQERRPGAAPARVPGDGTSLRVLNDPKTVELISALAGYPSLVEELFDAVPAFSADWLPPASRALAWSVIDVLVRDPSGAALTALVSEHAASEDDAVTPRDVALRLPPEHRRALAQIMAGEGPASQAHARCAVFDCIARLEDEVLKSRYRMLSDRLESCNDPGQEEALLQEMQQILLAKGRGEQRRRSLLGQS
jgi:hypothetical protein